MTSLAAHSITLGGRTMSLDPRIGAAAIVRDIRTWPLALKAWLGALSVVLALAAVAALVALPPGWEVFGTTPTVEWGLLIAGYVFFAICTSGLCLASSLGTVFGIERFRPFEKRHAILALLSLITAFGVIVLDLHYPVRMLLGAVLSPSPSSPMWWMGVFYGGYLVILLVEVWSMFWAHPRIHQIACTMACCMAVVAPATLGAVFGVLANRPSWYGPFTPILMVASAFLAGTCVLGIVFSLVVKLRLTGLERARTLAVPAARFLLTIALVVVAILVARGAVAGLLGTERGGRAAALALLGGPYALEFWLFRVTLGLVVPFVLVLLPATRTAAGTFSASVLALVGVFFDRLLLVEGGQVAPYSAASGVVSAPYASYSPSIVEILIILGSFAFIAFAYTLAERYLDLGESDAHVGWRNLFGRRHLEPTAAGSEPVVQACPAAAGSAAGQTADAVVPGGAR